MFGKLRELAKGAADKLTGEIDLLSVPKSKRHARRWLKNPDETLRSLEDVVSARLPDGKGVVLAKRLETRADYLLQKMDLPLARRVRAVEGARYPPPKETPNNARRREKLLAEKLDPTAVRGALRAGFDAGVVSQEYQRCLESVAGRGQSSEAALGLFPDEILVTLSDGVVAPMFEPDAEDLHKAYLKVFKKWKKERGRAARLRGIAGLLGAAAFVVPGGVGAWLDLLHGTEGLGSLIGFAGGGVIGLVIGKLGGVFGGATPLRVRVAMAACCDAFAELTEMLRSLEKREVLQRIDLVLLLLFSNQLVTLEGEAREALWERITADGE